MAALDTESSNVSDREEFTCSVCLEFSCEPFYLKPCGHFTCKQCLLQLRKTQASLKCPICRIEVVDSHPHKEMERKMARMKNKCPGCLDLVELGSMRHHVMNCPILLNLQGFSIGNNKRWPKSQAFKQRGKNNPNFDKKQNDHFQKPRNTNDNNNFRQAKSDRALNQSWRHDEPRQPQPVLGENPLTQPSPRTHSRGGANHLNGRKTPQTSESKNDRAFNQSWRHDEPNVQPRQPQFTFGEDPCSTHLHDHRRGRKKSIKSGSDSEDFDEDNNAVRVDRPQLRKDTIQLPASSSRPTSVPLRVEDAYASSRQPSAANVSSTFEGSTITSRTRDNELKFVCPYCKEPNLARHELVSHCQSEHRSDWRAMVCPICASMPWGDPNQESQYLTGHLCLRHSSQAEDEEDDEEALVSRAVEASLREF